MPERMALVMQDFGIDTIQGRLPSGAIFHLDADNDVLYLWKDESSRCGSYGEETPEGFTEFRTDTGDLVGVTVVHYWRDFGEGSLEAAPLAKIKEKLVDWTSVRS